MSPADVVAAVERRAAAGGFALDGAQQAVLPVLAALLGGRRPRAGQMAGAYLWGGVGRGKTWLVDAAVADLPEGQVLRVHLHELFRRLHVVLVRHRGRGGMVAAVGDLLDGRRVVVLDELHLHDVGNAMLLGPVLRELVRRRMVLLATSNYAPEELLADPLHHHLVEPVIALLGAHLHVLEVDDGTDHRAARPTEVGREQVGGFATGAWLDGDGTAYLRAQGLGLPAGTAARLPLGSRSVPALGVDGDTVWFGFGALCGGLLSAADYLELAGRFSTWVLHGVPRLGEAPEAARQRFVSLVDVLCDRDRRLVLVGAPGPEELFAGEGQPPDVARTASRLSLLRQGREVVGVSRHPMLSVEHLYG
ncbi:cell division protein ZapE [Oryzihumus leptocrescens]|uniref:cell division protein ZapE n=1 Tax=Oryzihumus leptocrescens TaxID=297536 RepID=UPI001639B782|nr:cell division protein ZapE [Oryzihumus leptocrescens]